MEKLHRLFCIPFKKSEPLISRVKIETPEIILEKNIKPGFELLKSLKIKDKLLDVCQKKFGKNDYLIEEQINSQDNPDTDGDTDPWVSYTVKRNNNSKCLLKIGVLVGNFHGMSNQIYISEEPEEKGKDYFKYATILLDPKNQNVFECEKNGEHQTTEVWIDEKLESFVNPKK